MGETDHQVEGYQQAEETECYKREELALLLGRYYWVVSEPVRRLNTKREGSSSGQNERKEKD